MKPKISVIVPIYNTAQYLDKCLQSILQQTMQEIEIICVDDCSPDDSYLIVEKYRKQDERIKLIRHKVSKGSGGARNTGILAAKADFLAGVDSDDYIKPEMMQTLWDASENGRFDVVCCGYEKFDENGDEQSHQNYSSVTLHGKDIDIFFTMNPMFWNKLWRKSLFIKNEVYFPEKLYYQDLATTPRILAKSQSIRIIDNNLYTYLVRSTSVSATFSAKHIIDTFKVLEILSTFLSVNDIYSLHKNKFKELVDSTVLSHSNRVSISKMSEKEKNQYLRYMLLLKLSFSEYMDDLKLKRHDELIEIIQNKIKVGTLNEEIKYKVIGYLFKPFLTKRQYVKLKNKPILFFEDSKSKLTKSIGYVLRIL